jgi:hypothetical protein
LLHYIDAGGFELEAYPFGSRGPLNADALREKVGHITNIVQRDITWTHRRHTQEDPYEFHCLSP